MSDTKQYTWQDISHHNTAKSAWVYVDNDVYDVTKFIDRHPGGREMMLLMAGRDLTDLFATYHPFTDKPKQILKKFKIGTLKGPSEFGTFTPDTGFYKECQQQVGQYFKQNNIDYKAMYSGIWRYLFITIMIFGPWYIVWSHAFNLSFFMRFITMIIAGVFQGMLLIHTMHDCSHTAFGHTPVIWKYMGRMCLDLTCGCSFDAWLHQHTVGHHVYTNIIEVDPDCPMDKHTDIRRLMPSQQWCAQYRLQWIYLPVIYCLYSFKNRIQDLTQTLFGKHNGAMRVNPEFYNWESYIRQIVCKLFWFVRAIIYPIWFMNNTFIEFIPLFLTMELTTGYFLTFNFQVSHVSTGVIWPEPKYYKNKNKLLIDGEWAKLQIETSVDYGHNSWLCIFFSGALNYQSTHHLFPSVSQYHYPQITPIIKKLCKKYNVKFNHIPTFKKAFDAHIKQLYNMGLEPSAYQKLISDKSK